MSRSNLAVHLVSPPAPEPAPRPPLLRFLWRELKPKGKILTPFNVISGAIIAVGLVLIG